MKQYCTIFKRNVIKEVVCYRNKDIFNICKEGHRNSFSRFRICCFLEKNQMDRTKPRKD